MKYFIVTVILFGCAYKDQPPDIQKLKVKKDIKAEQKQVVEVEEESISTVEHEPEPEPTVKSNEPIWDSNGVPDYPVEKEMQCLVKAQHIHMPGTVKIGRVNDVCIYYSFLLNEALTFEELQNRFNE